jgi:hypothetical protein
MLSCTTTNSCSWKIHDTIRARRSSPRCPICSHRLTCVVGLVHDKSRVDLKVPTSSDLYLHVDCACDPCGADEEQWGRLSVARTFWWWRNLFWLCQITDMARPCGDNRLCGTCHTKETVLDKRGHCPKCQNFCFSGCNYIDACMRC